MQQTVSSEQSVAIVSRSRTLHRGKHSPPRLRHLVSLIDTKTMQKKLIYFDLINPHICGEFFLE